MYVCVCVMCVCMRVRVFMCPCVRLSTRTHACTYMCKTRSAGFLRASLVRTKLERVRCVCVWGGGEEKGGNEYFSSLQTKGSVCKVRRRVVFTRNPDDRLRVVDQETDEGFYFSRSHLIPSNTASYGPSRHTFPLFVLVPKAAKIA